MRCPGTRAQFYAQREYQSHCSYHHEPHVDRQSPHTRRYAMLKPFHRSLLFEFLGNLYERYEQSHLRKEPIFCSKACNPLQLWAMCFPSENFIIIFVRDYCEDNHVSCITGFDRGHSI